MEEDANLASRRVRIVSTHITVDIVSIQKYFTDILDNILDTADSESQASYGAGPFDAQIGRGDLGLGSVGSTHTGREVQATSPQGQ